MFNRFAICLKIGAPGARGPLDNAGQRIDSAGSERAAGHPFTANRAQPASLHSLPPPGRRMLRSLWLRIAADRGSNNSGSTDRAKPLCLPGSAARLPSRLRSSSEARSENQPHPGAATIELLRRLQARKSRRWRSTSRTVFVLAAIRRSIVSQFSERATRTAGPGHPRAGEVGNVAEPTRAVRAAKVERPVSVQLTDV